HFQGFAVVALALTHVAGYVDVRQEVHLYLDHAVALAGFAAPAFDVEGESSRTVAARAGFRDAGEELADRREQAGVGRRVRARGAANRALVDVHHLVEVLHPVEGIVRGHLERRGAVERSRRGREPGVV